jgi:protein O-mannosyl-transferase
MLAPSGPLTASEAARVDHHRLLLAAAVVLTFWPALAGGWLADDIRLLEHDARLRSGDFAAFVTQPLFGVDHGYWRPLTMVALFVGTSLGGAFGVHALALALHLANCFAVRMLAAKVLPPVPALWVAFVFALHPVQVESVAWCSAINDPLWVACALQAMLAASRWRERGQRRWLVAIGAWLLAALAAKETGAMALPLAIAATAWLPADVPTRERRRPVMATTLVALIAFVAWLAARAAMQTERLGEVLTGAGSPPLDVIASARNAAWVFMNHVALLLAPWPLSPMRPLVLLETPANLLLSLGCVAVVGLLCHWRRHVTPHVRLAGALLVLPLLPPLLYQQAIGAYLVADRYVYLTVAGLAVALALGLARNERAWRRPWLPWLVPVVLAPTSFAATWHWRDLESFTNHVVHCAPDDPLTLVMAADYRLSRAFDGDPWALAAATDLYRRTLAELADAPAGTQQRRAQATAQLGAAWCTLLQRGAPLTAAEAIGAFRSAVEAAPDNPAAWVGLGVAHATWHQGEAARTAFAMALRLDPRCAGARRGIEELQASTAGDR